MLRRCAVITGAGKVIVQEMAMPKPELNEVEIKVHASLISPGTEMSLVRRLRQKAEDQPPATFGYACAGEVVTVNGDARGLRPGMRVAAMGSSKAIHADRVNVPINLVIPIPDEVRDEEAAYACLGATSLQAVRRAEPQLSDYGLVIGLGIVGNLAMQLGRLSGARMMGWEGLTGRRRMAAACGLAPLMAPGDEALGEVHKFTAPYGVDFAIFAFGGDATGTFEKVRDLMRLSADGHRMGRVVLVGGCRVCVDGGATSGNLDIVASSRTGAGYHDPQWERGADYPAAFVRYTTQRNLHEIINLIREKRLCVTPMTTHRFPLSDVGQAADALIETPDQAMGIILEMGE